MTHTPDMTPGTARHAARAFLSDRSPQILILMTLSCGGIRLAMGHWSIWDGAIAAGLFLCWPLNEWLIHVYLLHYKPITFRGRQFDFQLPQTHREHHADPWRLERVFIPKHIFPITLPLLLLAAVWIAPTLELAMTFLSVYFLLGLNYEWTHYLSHVRWNIPIGYYQRRVKAHRAHHFRNENLWWGVSRGEADWLLRTAPDIAGTESSGTTKSLLPSA